MVTGPINIGNPGEFTMLELAQEVIAITNSKSKIIHQPLPQDDPNQRRPDISKAQRVAGLRQPTIPLRQGLERTIDYFKTLAA